MVETVVSSSFNFYDIFVRLGPGCILVGCFYSCFNRIIPPLNMDSTFIIVLNIAIAYIAGTLIRALFRFFKVHLDNIVFGGNPRDLFPDRPKGKKKAVIKEIITREIAKKHVTLIVKQQGNLIHGQQDVACEHDYDSKRKNHFAFSHMVNCLELNGKSGKSDRICSLVDMCSSLMVTLFLCFLMLSVNYILFYTLGFDCGGMWNHKLATAIIAFITLLTGFISAYYLYIHYTQMRFAMIVQLYNIWKNSN